MEATIEDTRRTFSFLSLTATLTLTAFLLVSECVLALPLPQAVEPQPVSATAGSSTVAAPQTVPEMTSREGTTSFKVNVRLVQVRVVVRDSRGKAIGNLSKEDFQLFDNGKLQDITKFDIEAAGARTSQSQIASGAGVSTAITAAPPIDTAERYIAYLFDDVHGTIGSAWTDGRKYGIPRRNRID